MKAIILTIAIMITLWMAVAQPPMSWIRTYGGPNNYVAYDVGLTPDGGYAIYGHVESSGGFYRDAYLLKTDSSGIFEWARVYGQVNLDDFFAGYPAQDGGHAMIGYTTPCNDSNGTQMWFFRASNLGDSLFSSCIGTIRNDGATDVKQTPDGGYIISGWSTGPLPDGDKLLLTKVTSEGQQIWTREFGGPQYGYPGRIDLVDNGCVFAGGFFQSQSWTYRPYVVCVNQDGDVVWSASPFSGPPSEVANAVKQTRNGDFVVACGGYYVGRPLMLMTRNHNNGIWNWTTYPGSYFVHDMDTTLDQGFVVSGIDNQHPGLWIAKFDSSRALQWQDWIGGPGMDALALRQLGDGSLIVAGTLNSNPQRMVLAKICAENSNYGRLSYLSEAPLSAALSLEHLNGAIEEVIFPDVPTNSYGWVTGTAAQTWNCLEGGDGNNGDSIIFRASVPLESGVLDSFWISRLDARCHCQYRVECLGDSLENWNGSITITEFSGGLYGDDAELNLFTSNEFNIQEYQFWGRDSMAWSHFVLLETLVPENDSLPHHYLVSVHHEYQYLLKAVDAGGCIREYPDLILTRGVNLPVGDQAPNLTPDAFGLQVHPNPFNASAIIALDIPVRSSTSLIVHDLLGRHITTLHDGILEAGEHRFTFDASSLPSGIYFARVQAGEFVQTQKLLLLK